MVTFYVGEVAFLVHLAAFIGITIAAARAKSNIILVNVVFT